MTAALLAMGLICFVSCDAFSEAARINTGEGWVVFVGGYWALQYLSYEIGRWAVNVSEE